jgi:hypothetical protein
LNGLAFWYKQGNCDTWLESENMSRHLFNFCLQGGSFGAPLRSTDIEGAWQIKGTRDKLTDKTIEETIRAVVGPVGKVELLDDTPLFHRFKLSGSKNIIIKSRSAWELVYITIVQQSGFIHGLLDGYYKYDLGTSPPSDQELRGISLNDFPNEANDLLRSIVTRLAKQR